MLAGRGLYQCNRCKKQTSPTAGTIFHATKLPLTLWFAAIHLITAMGFKVASRVRGLSDEAFREAFGTEEQCRTALVRLRWPDGFVCRTLSRQLRLALQPALSTRNHDPAFRP